MPRLNLKSMSFDALVELRESVHTQLGTMRATLERQLASLSGTGVKQGRRVGGGSSLKGRKVPPKYRNPKNRAETWAGRGATPRWLQAQLKAGKKLEDFVIGKRGPKPKGK